MSELNVDNLRNAIDLYKRKQYEEALPIFYQFAQEGYVVAGFYIGVNADDKMQENAEQKM